MDRPITKEASPATVPAREPAGLIEDLFERGLFASRWLLAPFFGGLALSLAVLLVKFAQELWHLLEMTVAASGTELIVELLGLVDLTLVASLIVIVIFSGYENFVSRIDHDHHRDWPSWMGTIDFTGLKIKVLSSIVAISAIQLLRLFLEIGQVSDRELSWSVGMLGAFVMATILLALADRIGGHGGG